MSMHAVREFVSRNGFDALASALEDRVQAGHVRAALDPVVVAGSRRVLYCYTQSAVVDRAWDGVVDMARGLILDLAARTVVATPFAKFFNHGEVTSALPSEAFEVFDKLDGSLGVIWHDGVRWRVSTKGSFTSPQAVWASAWLGARNTSALTPGHTYCAEVIYDANRIVIRYAYQGIVLLAAWDEHGVEYDWPRLSGVAGDLGARCVDCHPFDSFDAMREAVAGFAADREGFVVRFASGHRVKVKGAEYLRIHRLISRVTPLALWDVMQSGGDLDVIRRDIPEEFWTDFDAIRAVLTDAHDTIVRDVAAEVARLAGESDKDVGLNIEAMSPTVRPFIFTARRAGTGWQHNPKARTGIFRLIRPTGNVLPGYAPSGALANAMEEIAG